MKIAVCILLCLCSCTCLAQEADLDLIRLSRRVPFNTLGEKQIDQINSLSSDSDQLSPQRTYSKSFNDNIENERRQKLQQEPISYRVNSNNNKDNNGRKHSISTVTLQLHLDDKPTIATSSQDDYDNEPYQDTYKSQKKDSQRDDRKHHDLSDSHTGASNIDTAVRYAMPPDSFLNNYRQQKQFTQNDYRSVDRNNQFSTPEQQGQFFSSPSSVGASGGSAPADINSQYQGRSSGNNNVQVLPPPSQNYYQNQNQQNRVQYFSNSQPYPEISGSAGNYVSTPAPNIQKVSNQQQQQQIYNNYINQAQSSNVQYVSSPAPSVQFLSTPTPSSQFIDKISQHKPEESINQYVATPAPNKIQPTLTPNNLYVSTPTHFVSTPSPIQYATSSPNYGSRISNYQNQINNRLEKQMQIDHFDNAVSGVRNPKYSSVQSSGNVFVSTTPGPIIISSTGSPINQERVNDQNWRSSVDSSFNYQSQPQSQNNYQSQVQPQNNFPSQSQNNFHPNPTAVNSLQQQPTPVNNYQQQPTQVHNYQPQSTSINNYRSQPTPVNNFQSPSPSINNVNQHPTQVNSYQQQPTSVNNFQQQQPTPVNNFQQQQPTSVNNYQQQQPTPVNNFQQQRPTSDNNYQSPSSITNYQSQEIHNQNKNSLFDNSQQSHRPFSNLRQSQSFSSQNIPRETLFSSEMDIANNLMINALHQNYIGEKQHIMKTTYQRDIEKDIDVAPTNSYSNFGWKLSPKRGSIEIANEPHDSIGENIPGVYTFSSPSSDFTSTQVVTQQSTRPVVEYRPYPENPFLNHIAFATASPPLSSGSIQTINFQPDNNQQHNVNVGYSIGFGNLPESSRTNNKNEQSYSNKYPLSENFQSFTTVSSSPSTSHGDIIKGVQVSQVQVPDQSFIQKHLNGRNNYAQNEILKAANSKQLSFSSPGNQIPVDSTHKSSQISKSSEVPSSGKLYQYFINTPPTKTTNIVSSYHGNDESKSQNPNYKWSSILGAGVEVSSSPNVDIMKQVIRESPSSNSIIYLNRESPKESVSNGNSYFYPPQKENSGKLVIQNFDHEKALKNIQPIGLSNVVSQSSSLGANAVVTISPQYSIEQSLGHDIEAFTQNQVQAPHNSFSTPHSLDVSNAFRNYKPFDKEKVFNLQSFKPSDILSSDNSELRSYIFGNPNDAKSYEQSLKNQNQRQSDESAPLHYIFKNSPSDSRIHSSNTETRQIDYTPSESFRQHLSKTNYHSHKNEQNQPQYNKITLDDSIQKGHTNYHIGNEQVASTRYGNPLFFNQNLVAHKTEPSAAGSDTSYQLISSSNKRQGSEDNSFDHGKDSKSDNKIMTIHGMKVANPYNIDLKVLSDLLQGRPAVDESKLDKLNNFHPVQLDTSLIRDLIARNEKVRFDFPKDVLEDSQQDSPHFEHLRSPRRKTVGSEISEKAKMFRHSSSGYEAKSDIPEFDQGDYREHVHSLLGTHHIGAVIDQPIGFVPSQRSSDEPSGPELDDISRFSDPEYLENQSDEKQSETNRRPVKIHNEKQRHHEKRINPELDTPYPLLQPPRLSPYQRSQKKSDRRPLMPRNPKPPHNKHSKSSRESIEDFDMKHNIQTELRPPPVLIIKKSG